MRSRLGCGVGLPTTFLNHLPALAFGSLLALAGLVILFRFYRQRPGEDAPRGRERATGRIIRDYFEPGVVMVEPMGTTSPTAWLEYEFEALGGTHRAKEAVNESYVVRVDGYTRRLGSLSAGEEVPVWYFNGDPSDCTVMPMAVAGRFLRSEIGWALAVIGAVIVGFSVRAI